MIILKESGFGFPDFQISDLHRNIQVPLSKCNGCNVGLDRTKRNIICARCYQRACVKCKTRSTFPNFNLREVIQICWNCCSDLSVSFCSNEEFKSKILRQINGHEIFTNQGKFIIPDYPFNNCKKGMKNLYLSGRFSDMRLIAETGKMFNVHKIILAGE
jgi:hypothetical protein